MSGCVKMLPFDSPLPPTTGSSESPGDRHLVDGAERRPALRELGLEDERRRALAGQRDAMPITIWSRPQRTQKSTISSETPAPASMPAPKPSHSLPPW